MATGFRDLLVLQGLWFNQAVAVPAPPTIDLFRLQIEAAAPNRQIKAGAPSRQVEGEFPNRQIEWTQ